MKKFMPFILLFLICWTLAIVCLSSSVSVRNGYEACTEADGISFPPVPKPSNCADYPTLSLLSSNILDWCGLGLFILPFGVSLVLNWKNNHSDESNIESIKFVV